MDENLVQALRTLRGIRQRYETALKAHPHITTYQLNVAIGHADMSWMKAVIEALERQQRRSDLAA
jgi:hypothetical protein